MNARLSTCRPWKRPRCLVQGGGPFQTTKGPPPQRAPCPFLANWVYKQGPATPSEEWGLFYGTSSEWPPFTAIAWRISVFVPKLGFSGLKGAAAFGFLEFSNKSTPRPSWPALTELLGLSAFVCSAAIQTTTDQGLKERKPVPPVLEATRPASRCRRAGDPGLLSLAQPPRSASSLGFSSRARMPGTSGRPCFLFW